MGVNGLHTRWGHGSVRENNDGTIRTRLKFYTLDTFIQKVHPTFDIL
jgi:hypothetical protein